MQFVHRISFSANEKQVKKFNEVGVDIDIGFTTFVIKESDKNWTIVRELLSDIDVVDFLTTDFTRAEINQAKLFAIGCNRHQGYPQPENEFGYLDQVYDTSNCCKTCGFGRGKQKNPFRFTREPKWGKANILQLNWIYDEFFTTPVFYQMVFKPIGLNYREVVHHKNNTTLATVVQLIIPEIDVSLKMPESSATESCMECGNFKFQPWSRGYIPPLDQTVDLDIFKPNTLFGSGGESRKLVLISAALHRTLSEKAAKSLRFYPIETVDA